MTVQIPAHDLQSIRYLLLAAFTAEDLRRLRPGPLPSCLPTRSPHPHRTFYQLDPTTGTWEQV
jgi:hypothetical protein